MTGDAKQKAAETLQRRKGNNAPLAKAAIKSSHRAHRKTHAPPRKAKVPK
ncbi:hypothetical protein HMPREF0424_0413 [Gardnerella vaginalis 409-05]|nr:hypothetical protein HMPREF0424_0413 [Gardnerella vaginalis 409-05]